MRPIEKKTHAHAHAHTIVLKLLARSRPSFLYGHSQHTQTHAEIVSSTRSFALAYILQVFAFPIAVDPGKLRQKHASPFEGYPSSILSYFTICAIAIAIVFITLLLNSFPKMRFHKSHNIFSFLVKKSTTNRLIK